MCLQCVSIYINPQSVKWDASENWFSLGLNLFTSSVRKSPIKLKSANNVLSFKRQWIWPIAYHIEWTHVCMETKLPVICLWWTTHCLMTHLQHDLKPCHLGKPYHGWASSVALVIISFLLKADQFIVPPHHHSYCSTGVGSHTSIPSSNIYVTE